MPSVAVKNLENLLQDKRLGGTLGRVREVPRLSSTGVSALDQMLGGGWCRGAMSELIGPRSSGRTDVVLRTLAAATAQGQVVALIDTCDRFDPRAAEARGVALDALLWVRGAPLTIETARPPLIERAVKQAVRACDLVLRAGGFGIVVLDLADVPPRRVQDLPAITWLRLGHTTEGHDTVCLLIGDKPIARSAMGASVDVAARPVWTGSSPQSRLFAGVAQRFTVRAARMQLPLGDRARVRGA
jgi:recombination protein RecA